MQNISDEMATAILSNTRTRFTLVLQEEENLLKHETTVGKTSEGMSATTNPAAEYAASAIVGGGMTAGLHDA